MAKQSSYCSGKHSKEIVVPAVPHPAVKMSKARLKAWEDSASDRQFYEHLQELASIYAKRHYTGDGKVDETALFVDYKKWKDDGYGGKMKEVLPLNG